MKVLTNFSKTKKGRKMNNQEKIDLIIDDLNQWLDGSDDDGSMRYAHDNGYFLHAASLWLSTGAISEDIEQKIKGVSIDYKKEKIEIDEICKNAFIYICKDCNHHAFLDDDEGDDIECSGCFKTATIDNTRYNKAI